ncbi:MAG: metallophosphoesterase N-terminal domain-containing protein, partial [Chitinophagaceae bacterium]
MINRRNFLRNFGIAGAALTVTPVLAETNKIKKTGIGGLANLTLKGRVHSNGKGIANVAVTDGFQVTVTDSKGNYELLSNNTAEFVYISVPSGYSFPAEKGIARFYKAISQKEGEVKSDFNLEKLEIDDSKHNFVVWADTQMISKADAEQLKAQSVPDLRNLVQSYPKTALFHGIGCGDLVWDKFELFEDYKQAIETTGVTFFNVIGNHDMDLDARTDEYAAKTFKQQFGPTYYSFNRGDIHYVTLDDVFFIGTEKKYIGYITENQLHWLEQDLALVKPGTTIVLSLHIPTNTGAARRTQKEESISGVVSNRKQLYKMLAPYKVHIMSGHTHFNE